LYFDKLLLPHCGGKATGTTKLEDRRSSSL
jgi:hypothetical protein